MAVASEETIELTPIQREPDEIAGKYASIDISPEPMFGPDELGSLQQAVEDLTQTATMADSSARIFEVLQTWEARLFSRGYHFLNASRQGWNLFAGSSGTGNPSSILAAGNAMKLFPVNVYGAREDKICAALSREIPTLKFSPKDPDSPPDQTASDEADNYLKVWLVDAGIKDAVRKTSKYFYTDDRVVYWTASWADEQRWGTETPDESKTFGDEQPEGVTPETEMQPAASSDAPAIAELTKVYGKLESKVPIYCDDVHSMGWARIADEINVNILKERYPWIADKISAGAGVAGSSDQYDRMARINVRLAVQTSSATGESWQSDATETHTWFRPSMYRAIKDKDERKMFYDNFPDGLRVTHAGSQLAFVRNEALDKHITILHPKEGEGQNRRAIGTNYLPLQKVLNANIGLLNKYFIGCVPRRFAAEGPIDVAAVNAQTNDPSIITPVLLDAGQSIQNITGIENVPQPTTGLMEWVQWLVDGAPEAMDGATPAMFGAGETGTVGEATLNRDQALQVFSAPWASICMGLASAATQAVASAAENRQTDIRSRTPGSDRLTVEIANLQGDALCYPESLEIPQTLAERESQMAMLLEQSPNVAIYQAIVSDPRNLLLFSQMPALSGFELPGLDAVEKQQGEFELLFDSGPLDNPLYLQGQQQLQALTQHIQQGQTDPEAQTPQGQQMMQDLQQQAQQLNQQLQSIPPKTSSVAVAQNGSENHAVESAITLGMMNSAEGRKLKNGNSEQQAIYANLELHWQEHEQMKQKLTPVKPLEVKASASVAIDKLPPNVQAQALQAMGVQAMPADFESQNELVPHEVTVEKEGVDANGVPVKQKISTVNPDGKLD